jgi:hypothetical protein
VQPPASEAQMRDDGGADHATGFDGDLQSIMPPQAEADVVSEVFVASRVSNITLTYIRNEKGTRPL